MASGPLPSATCTRSACGSCAGSRGSGVSESMRMRDAARSVVIGGGHEVGMSVDAAVVKVEPLGCTWPVPPGKLSKSSVREKTVGSNRDHRMTSESACHDEHQ